MVTVSLAGGEQRLEMMISSGTAACVLQPHDVRALHRALILACASLILRSRRGAEPRTHALPPTRSTSRFWAARHAFPLILCFSLRRNVLPSTDAQSIAVLCSMAVTRAGWCLDGVPCAHTSYLDSRAWFCDIFSWSFLQRDRMCAH
eukprot:3120785-Pleurochrysis_carterae.AAC.1